MSADFEELFWSHFADQVSHEHAYCIMILIVTRFWQLAAVPVRYCTAILGQKSVSELAAYLGWACHTVFEQVIAHLYERGCSYTKE